MITLWILNHVFAMFDSFLNGLFAPLYYFIADLSNNISALQVPTTLIETASLVAYFLPLGTMLILFNITIGLLALQLALGLLHFIVHGLGIL